VSSREKGGKVQKNFKQVANNGKKCYTAIIVDVV